MSCADSGAKDQSQCGTPGLDADGLGEQVRGGEDQGNKGEGASERLCEFFFPLAFPFFHW